MVLILNSIQSIAICRLVLNLRQLSGTHLSNKTGHTVHECTLPEIRFATSAFLGNIGAPVREGVDEKEEDVGVMERSHSRDEMEMQTSDKA